MESVKVKKSEFVSAMAKNAGLSKKDTRKELDALIKIIMETVKEGEKVLLMNLC